MSVKNVVFIRPWLKVANLYCLLHQINTLKHECSTHTMICSSILGPFPPKTGCVCGLIHRLQMIICRNTFVWRQYDYFTAPNSAEGSLILNSKYQTSAVQFG